LADKSTVSLIRFIHRWTGILLIVLVGLKIISGYIITGNLSLLNQESGYKIHYAMWLDIPLVLIFTFHAAYGILKIYIPKSNEKKKKAFVITSVLALLVFAASMIFIYWI
jgi:succinate dehydrogenase/fumarate reductase cytochrome b subunit